MKYPRFIVPHKTPFPGDYIFCLFGFFKKGGGGTLRFPKIIFQRRLWNVLYWKTPNEAFARTAMYSLQRPQTHLDEIHQLTGTLVSPKHWPKVDGGGKSMHTYPLPASKKQVSATSFITHLLH